MNQEISAEEEGMERKEGRSIMMLDMTERYMKLWFLTRSVDRFMFNNWFKLWVDAVNGAVLND